MNDDGRPTGDWVMPIDFYKNMIQAIIEIKDQMHAEDLEPDAEHWVQYDEKFAEIRRKVVAKWSLLTNKPYWRFPFSDGCVKSSWVGYRKLKKELKPGCRKWAGVESTMFDPPEADDEDLDYGDDQS